MAISAYLEASWTRGRPDLRERALRALDFLWDAAAHERCRHAPLSLAPKARRSPGLLGDQAWTALAALDAYEVAGRPQDLERAKTLAAFMVERLGAENRRLLRHAARRTTTLGRLSTRQTPLKENSIAAHGLPAAGAVDARRALRGRSRGRRSRGYAHVAESQGYFASDYAKAVDLLLNPGAEVKIVAPGRRAARGAPRRRARAARRRPRRSASSTPATPPRSRPRGCRRTRPPPPTPATARCVQRPSRRPTICSRSSSARNRRTSRRSGQSRSQGRAAALWRETDG